MRNLPPNRKHKPISLSLTLAKKKRIVSFLQFNQNRHTARTHTRLVSGWRAVRDRQKKKKKVATRHTPRTFPPEAKRKRGFLCKFTSRYDAGPRWPLPGRVGRVGSCVKSGRIHLLIRNFCARNFPVCVPVCVCESERSRDRKKEPRRKTAEQLSKVTVGVGWLKVFFCCFFSC